MASQEDDNKLESKSNINKEQERNFINVYKKFEYILKNKLEPFSKKIESLIEIWKSLGQCNQQNSDIGYIIQIMDWAKLHTLNIVLTGKWKMFKADFESKLLNEVEKTQNELMKISDVFSKKFQKLADVIKNPWDDPVLANLLHDSNAIIGQKEIEFFCVETAYLVSVRLKKLCESQCEDLALNLVTAFMNCYNLSQTQNFSLNATKTHILFCFDIHVALLYRYNRRSDIVALFKKLSLEEGLQLIKRFAKKRVKISKVWRNYPEITFLASQVFVTAAVTKPIPESGGLLKELLAAWIDFSVEHSMVEKVEVSIRRIIQAATAAQHIYICCEIIHDKFGLKLRTFTIELYIRALTTDMNNLESQKTENDHEKIEETTKRLATGFYNLADILKDNIQVSRECALTAFSLEPTLERLRKIEDLARLSGFNVLDTGQIWKCKLHPPVTAADEICWMCNSCGKWMCKPNLDLRLTTNFALNEALNFETLGISSQLCDDLAVVLNGPRYHLLSWLLRWEDLHRLCEMYLNDMERTKNLVTELKFVDIDYSMFATVKREPIDEMAGIERGYESFLYGDEKLVDLMENSNPEPPELPQVKSDPDTLKTLRMFRHNVKRNKPQVVQGVLASNNQENNSQSYRENLFSGHYSDNVNFSQHRLSHYQQNLSDQHSERTFSDVFFNHLKHSMETHNTFDTAIDFSSNSNRDRSQETLDFRNDFNKAKTSDILENAATLDCDKYQTVRGSTGDNFLHNMITYEFARVTSEMKVKKTEVSTQKVDRAQQKSTCGRLTPMQASCASRGTGTMTGTSETLDCEQYKRTPHSKISVIKEGSEYFHEKSMSLLEYFEKSKGARNKQTSVVKHPDNRKCPEKSSPIPQQKIRNNHQLESLNLSKCDKSPQYSSNQATMPKPQTFVKHDQSRNLSRNDNTITLNRIPEYKSKEDETLAPSKGFPSFDKIPPPPTQNRRNEPSQSSSSLSSSSSSSSISNVLQNLTPVKSVDKPPSNHPAESLQVYVASSSNKGRAKLADNFTATKNDDLYVFNSRSVLKRPTADPGSEMFPEKKIKLDDEKFRPKNGIPLSIEKELSRNAIIKSLLTKNEKIETSIQNENSSKNANCCLPTDKDAVNKSDSCKKVSVLNCRTPTVQNTQSTPSANNNNQKNVSGTEAPCCKSQESSTEVTSRNGIGKADNKIELEEVKNDLHKDTITQSKTSLLKTLSEQHIPMIVEKLSSEIKGEFFKESVGKINDCLENLIQNNRNCAKSMQDKKLQGVCRSEGDKSKTNTNKELKIILHRLSDEMIKSFIPTHMDTGPQTCNCGYVNNHKKRPIGRPRKIMCCKYRISSLMKNSTSNTNRVFERIDYEKYSLRTLRKQDSDRLQKISPKNPRRNSDTEKKTGSNKGTRKFNCNKKKFMDDSDKLKKPKKDSSDTDEEADPAKKDDGVSKPTNNMNPRVVLERLPLDSNYVRSVLSNVPGLNDYEMIRPTNVNHIVNVVQISGGRSTSNVPVQNTQTSTQITPHIQRIGQPRADKPEHNSNSDVPMTTTTTTPPSTSATTKPSTSQPSTLINILSQQIIRPGQQSNCARNRSSPLINILSQQIIRPATTQHKTPQTSTQSEQSNPTKVNSTAEQPNPEESSTTSTKTTTTNSHSSGQGTILQLICSKSTLPKFQQAFGKSVYQNNTEGSEAPSAGTETATNADTNKKTSVKNSSMNIQPIQGGVIYTRQMPMGQTINFIPPGRGQVFRIATSNSDQISLVKDTVIHSKMSALLAAALQGKQKTSESQSDGENTNEEGGTTRVTVTRPTLVQNARIVKPVLHVPPNVIRTSPQSNLSSTTLEQLREFDMVYKQIKERSSTSTPSEANTSESSENPQRISVTYLNQGQKYTQLSPVVVVSSYCNLQPAASPALSVTSQGSLSPCVTPAPAPNVPKASSKNSKGKTVKNTTTQASKASPIPKPQQKPQEDEHTTQRIFDILAEYAEQLRNSPDLNNKPAPRRRSNPPTNPNQNSKRKKNSSSKKSGQCSSMASEVDIEDHRTVGSEDSSCGVVQISVQEEEQAQAQTVTTESNDSTSSSRQQLILTDAGSNQTRNLIIADSSVGEALKMPNTAVLVPGNYIMPVSMVKGGQQIAVVSGGSKILATVPARSGPNMLLFQSFLNQNRNKSGVPTVKYSTIQPISGISSQSIAGVSGQPPVILPPNSQHLTAVTLGQPLTLKKIDENERGNTELLLTISQSRDNGNSSSESTTHPDSTSSANIELEETIIRSDNTSEKIFHTYQKTITATPIATPVIAQTSCVKGDTVSEEQNSAHNSITLNLSSESNKSEPGKTLERVQSVLVTACTSNGPMLSHTPPRYRKPSESAGTNNEPSNKEEFLHNGEKQNNNEQKAFQGNSTYFHNKNKKATQRLDREMHQLCLQRKQAAIERELRLQKSLSEECEDLGVDEPSTSDLFPEADILFDANHSPSFDQSSQDLVKRPPPPPPHQEIKEENKAGMTLFSDDDNSSSLRTDFLFEPVEYQPSGGELEYDQNQQLTNGQSSASNESGSSCEDHTLLQNCASMSDVTLNSPVSPDPYHENTPPSLNKYKFKYSNRRKGERHKPASEMWTVEVSSSEDTTGSTELGKSSSHSPESCTNKHGHSVSCDEELSDGSYKVVAVAIAKSDLLKDDESCEELHCEDLDLDCSPSGRGARRSVKKMCSCCNGSQAGGASRKRPSSRPHTPAPHKKAFLHKKR